MHTHTAFRPTAFSAGFDSVETGHAGVKLRVEGEIPAWLDGILLRTGPAKFEAGTTAYRHWFDGLAMLHRFDFAGGGVVYGNRFLESTAYLEAQKKGAAALGEFATNPPKSFLSRLLPMAGTAPTDNGNVNVVAYGPDDIVALTETTRPVRFDPETLATRGAFEWKVKAGGQITTAHPQYDAGRRLIYNFETVLGKKSSYRIYQMAPGSATPKVIAEIATDRPSYIHSFAMSGRFIILGEFPLTVHPLRLLFGGQPFIEAYRWMPERGLRFTIVDKDTGAIVKQVTTEACFSFHHVNAYDEDGAVAIDLIAYPDTGIMKSLYLDHLREKGSAKPGAYVRYTIPLGAGNLVRETISATPLEFPRIDYGRDAGRKHRYVWGASQNREDFIDSIVKLDVVTGSVLTWSRPWSFPGEPVFVPDPESGGGDQGVLLAIVLDGDAGRSSLVVLDSATLKEVAHAVLPAIVPFGFHGNYFSAGDFNP